MAQRQSPIKLRVIVVSEGVVSSKDVVSETVVLVVVTFSVILLSAFWSTSVTGSCFKWLKAKRTRIHNPTNIGT